MLCTMNAMNVLWIYDYQKSLSTNKSSSQQPKYHNERHTHQDKIIKYVAEDNPFEIIYKRSIPQLVVFY